MAYFLGIDGGGTKTRCVLADEATIIAKAMTGGSSVIRCGEQPAREALHMAIRRVCSDARISTGSIRAVCIGVTGAARSEIAETIRRIITELIPAPAKIDVVGDHIIALEAAFGAGSGVIAIAGTGSIVYGRDAHGHTARAGGWGFAVSDEGSGHWIGRRAVSALLSAHDEGVETALTGRVFEAWKLNTIDELVQHANATPPPDFPRLFRVVLHAAADGDTISSGLLEDAGARLAALAVKVVRRLAPHAEGSEQPVATLPVAMTGSVFRQSADVRGVFYNQLQKSFPGIDVRQDLADPVAGALSRAQRM
ncbi:MAG: BadF/BadG/BcrA/BcrD ATPase family protein [Terriglobales bacterium]